MGVHLGDSVQARDHQWQATVISPEVVVVTMSASGGHMDLRHY